MRPYQPPKPYQATIAQPTQQAPTQVPPQLAGIKPPTNYGVPTHGTNNGVQRPPGPPPVPMTPPVGGRKPVPAGYTPPVRNPISDMARDMLNQPQKPTLCFL
jgi:hypothetical protein